MKMFFAKIHTISIKYPLANTVNIPKGKELGNTFPALCLYVIILSNVLTNNYTSETLSFMQKSISVCSMSSAITNFLKSLKIAD